ncbi:MAG: hypothetical protein V3V28_11965 [Polaribacter sp.]|uniref:hypothetical protein n=1 Tax=Polaribacter sp. TaxID=1920175 RepID=UPI002F3539D6
MKNFRKPYLSIIMASVFLFVSCSQYDSESQDVEIVNKFDDTILNNFKNNLSTFHNVMKEVTKIKTNKRSTNSIESQNEILGIINKNYNTNIQIEGNLLELSNLNSNEILSSSLKNGWITKKDVELTKSLIDNIELEGFDLAIKKYAEDVEKLSLSKEEFSKKNIFVNTLKFINFQNPNYFKVKGFLQRDDPDGDVGVGIVH